MTRGIQAVLWGVILFLAAGLVIETVYIINAVGPARESDYRYVKGDEYVVRVDLPGMKKAEMDVEVEDNYLRISDKREEKEEKKKASFSGRKDNTVISPGLFPCRVTSEVTRCPLNTRKACLS